MIAGAVTCLARGSMQAVICAGCAYRSRETGFCKLVRSSPREDVRKADAVGRRRKNIARRVYGGSGHLTPASFGGAFDHHSCMAGGCSC